MIHSKRFSIRTFMAIMVIAALGLAVVTQANDISAGLTLLAVVAIFRFALMAFYRTPFDRRSPSVHSASLPPRGGLGPSR
jgi:NADH:ubiquinone oxidoreductase subunit 2 (subunit N)